MIHGSYNNNNSNMAESSIQTHTVSRMDNGEYFGVLKINMGETKITTCPLFLLFTIDITGSMQSPAGFYSASTKLDYVKQTFHSMIHYLSTQPAEIYIRVHAFNTSVKTVVDTILITPDNVADLTAKIRELDANECTDIGLALDSASSALTKYAEMHPDHQVVHVFMTDGEPTVGERNAMILAESIETTFTNIFVGIGAEHNAGIMRKLSEVRNAEYQYVDNMENTSLVYGETIHRCLYPAVKEVNISMVDALIYDWQTNMWTSVLYEPLIVGDFEKIYHIKSTGMHLAEAHFSGKYCDGDREFSHTVCAMPPLIGLDELEVPIVDLSKYLFRQRVQELLYEGKDIDSRSSCEEIDTYRNLIKDLFREIRDYMRTSGLMDDPFMKMLCDDISITYKYVGTRHAQMAILSRQTAQGRQQTYTPMNISTGDTDSSCGDSFVFSPRRYRDGPPHIGDTVMWSTDDDVNTYTPSQTNISCYASPRMLNTMSTMSQSVDPADDGTARIY
jgi:hypothetical protein